MRSSVRAAKDVAMPNVEADSGNIDAATRLALERTVLSYERTMLAWVRTSTSLITFGFGIQQFFRATRGPDSDALLGPRAFGLTMILIGLLALLLATLDHRTAIARLSAEFPVVRRYPGTRFSRARILGALIAILGLLAFFSALLRA
jgi:putative membrane protein